MVNVEIVGGLKSALERGEPLQKAMISLLNSGYHKEEIEAGARALQQEKIVSIPIDKNINNLSKKNIQQTPINKTEMEKVSFYGKPVPKQMSKGLKIALII